MPYDVNKFRGSNSRIHISPDQIESWVARYFDYKPRKSGEELRICNPFDGDTGYHFNISIVKATCNDWRGNEWVGINPRTGEPNKCTFLKFVQLYKGCSFPEAIKDVLGASFDIRSFRAARKYQEQKESQEKAALCLPDGSRPLREASGKIASGLKAYLKSRGIDDRKLAKYRMMYDSFEIVWPYYEYDELVYWQSRSRINKRFNFPPESTGVKKSEFIYGFDYIEPSSYLIITEAILDAQTIDEQSAASGGAIIQPKQARKIKALNPRNGIVLAPDNDVAGMQSILSNYKILEQFRFPIYFSIPPEIEYEENGEKKVTKDWNDVGKVEGWKRVKPILDKNTEKLSISTRVKLSSRISKAKRPDSIQ